MYEKDRMSHSQIAKHFGVGRMVVQRWFEKLEIKPRTNGESQTAVNEHRFPGLNPQQEQLVYGSLLGDACLYLDRFTSNKKTEAKLSKYTLNFAHTNKKAAYLKHKRDVMGAKVKMKSPLTIGHRTSGHGSTMDCFVFAHKPTLTTVAALVHNKNHKKSVNQKWLNKLNLHGIAYWYQDDGCIRINKRTGQRSVIFYTNSFNMKEQKLLQKLLKKHGLTAIISKSPNGTPGEFILAAHRQAEVSQFLDKIKPFIVPCMRYKLRNPGKTI